MSVATGVDHTSRTDAIGSPDIFNDRREATLSWQKTDATDGTPLAGSVWALQGDGLTREVIDNGTYDLDPAVGKFRVNIGVKWGEYKLWEHTAPAGYQLPNPNPVRTLTFDGEHLEQDLGAIGNTRAPGTLSWQKTDATSGDRLAGSAWTLEGPHGYTATVTDNGTGDTDPADGAISVGNLEWGDYTVKEKSAPTGYEPTDRVLTAHVDAANLNATLNAVTNQRSAGSLSWSKVEAASGAALPGSTWTLDGPNGYSVTVSDNLGIDANAADGGFAIKNVAWGTYTLTEKEAPAGFVRDTTPRTVVIDATHLAGDFGAVENSRTPDEPGGTLPFTGPTALWTYATIGALSVGAGVLLMVRRRRSES